MGKRWLWIGLTTCVLLTGLLLAAQPWKKPYPVIQFADGRSTRVLKISYGTKHEFSVEPLWKQALRKVLPDVLAKSLGPTKEYNRGTAYDSLAIYFQPIEAKSSRLNARRVEVLFPDGKTSEARWDPGSPYPVMFGSYPRDARDVAVRIWDMNETVRVTVANPQIARRSVWTAPALPQTNYVRGTKVLLKEIRVGWKSKEWEPIFAARAYPDDPVGWMQWRTTLFDPWGNWSMENYLPKPRLPKSPGPRDERVFKLLAEGLEYISAGFVAAPMNGKYEVLNVNRRATNWSVQSLVLFGPGTYEISEAFVVQSRKEGLPKTNTLQTLKSGWLLKCIEPALFGVTDHTRIELRLRERFPDGRGRIFYGRKSGSATQGRMVAHLSAVRLPMQTSNLEAEVIVRWPAVEFFVQKPENSE